MSQHLLCESRTCSTASYHLNIPGRLMLVLDCVFMNRAERELCPVQPQSSPSACSWSVGVGGAHPFHWSFGEGGWGGMIGGQLQPWPACLGLRGNPVPKHHSKEKDGKTRLFRQMLRRKGTAWCLLPDGKAEAESHGIIFLEWYFTPGAWLNAASYLIQKCLFYYMERTRGCSTAVLNFGLWPEVIIVFILLAFHQSSVMKKGHRALKSALEFNFLYEQNLVLCV